MKESELAAPVIAWLQAEQWDVYQEVQEYALGRVADIVAVRAPLVWVIELKTTLGLAVLAQADHWLHRVAVVSVAVPAARTEERAFARSLCRSLGIGVLEVEMKSDSRPVFQNLAPSISRHGYKVQVILKDRLTDGHKTFATAGNCEGRRWSPFQETVLELKRMAGTKPGIELREAIKAMAHHYHSDQSAKASLAHWITRGKIKGVRVEGRPLRVYLEDPQ